MRQILKPLAGRGAQIVYFQGDTKLYSYKIALLGFVIIDNEIEKSAIERIFLFLIF